MKPGPVAVLTADEQSRFWSKVDKRGPDDCWPWRAGCAYGYGKFTARSKAYRAHRVSYSLANGGIQSDMLVCHRCDNPSCVNPNHLFLGTDADNSRDMATKGRAAKGAGNAAAKLSAADVYALRAAYAGGAPQRALARRFGVARFTVHAVVTGKSWTHIPETT